MKLTPEMVWHWRRSSPDDLREKGLSVDIHNDYCQNGRQFTYWQMSYPGPNGTRIAIIGEGETDAAALDKIRAKHAAVTDTLHHAPMCPANHYCGSRAPTGPCTCGASELQAAEAMEATNV